VVALGAVAAMGAGSCADLSGFSGGDTADASPDALGSPDAADAPTAPDAADAATDAPGILDGCPDAPGPTMVHLSYGSGFCIDSTEVTVGQYQSFLTAIAGGYSPPSPPGCAFDTSYAVAATTFCNMGDAFPEACVNWCQAYAFCAWAGKHLCGAIGGGPVPFDKVNDPTASAFAAACTSNGSRVYSYGASFAPVCNAPQPDGAAPGSGMLPVGADPGCEGPPGVFDLLGNVSEWLDSCTAGPDGSATDPCHHLGGAFDDPKTCTQLDDDPRAFPSGPTSYALGFRCCVP
jgi:formylglycine-generating enzyme required for sulfatase activity